MLKLYAIVFILLLSISVYAVGEVYPIETSAGMTPDNPLYFADVLYDEARIAFAGGNIEQAKVRFEIAEERLAESNYLVENNKSQLLPAVLQDYNIKTNQTLTSIKSLKEAGEDTTELNYISDRIYVNVIEIKNVYESTPEVEKPDISSAVVESTQNSVEIVSELTPEKEIEVTQAAQPIILPILGEEVVAVAGCKSGTIDSKTSLTLAGYSVYATQGSTSWVKIVIKDGTGTVVDTLIVDSGSTKSSSVTGLEIEVIAVRALSDGTIVGADVEVCKRAGLTSLCKTGVADATSPVIVDNYYYYVDEGSNDLWGTVVIKDSFGATIDILTVYKGHGRTSTLVNKTVNMVSIKALQDGTVIAAELKICPYLILTKCKNGTVNATTYLEFKTYRYFSDYGLKDNWARIVIKNQSSTVDIFILDNGSYRTSTITSTTVELTGIRALTDGTVVGADIEACEL